MLNREILSSIMEVLGPCRPVGSVCNSTQPPVQPVFELEARPVCNGDRCFLHQLKDKGGTHSHHLPLFRRENNSCFSSTNVECSIVVPSLSGAFDQQSTVPSQEKGPAHRSIQQIPPNGRSAVSRLEHRHRNR